jgi:DNA/RNA endonuclease G (NUC1)
MKRHFILFISLVITLSIIAQKIHKYDQVIDMTYYKSFYSKDIMAPSFVIYKLYKGGGDVSRSGMNFKAYDNLPHFSYRLTGYDKGHLANAEDFAWSKESLRSTFYYINAIPQTSKLNRGIWKKFETEIRKLSQTDSLLIICGGCDYNGIDVGVPQNCFKIVYNLRNHRCVYALMFKNNWVNEYWDEPKLKRKMSFKKAMKLYESTK